MPPPSGYRPVGGTPVPSPGRLGLRDLGLTGTSTGGHLESGRKVRGLGPEIADPSRRLPRWMPRRRPRRRPRRPTGFRLGFRLAKRCRFVITRLPGCGPSSATESQGKREELDARSP